ncbi:hypothetical protein GCM10010185_60510 [Saccharothrix coeruleofusca]|uniref:Uncharacterized protein n=1 Tax=Saccharothrix coeruleofusca TaxID=33919 RepID=A0A918EG27_9PSEU|nr:hypothetical protein GCM10010185_60510 [Saccharothrix coeruleofusca]
MGGTRRSPSVTGSSSRSVDHGGSEGETREKAAAHAAGNRYANTLNDGTPPQVFPGFGVRAREPRIREAA